MWGAIKKSINSDLNRPLNELIEDKIIIPNYDLLRVVAKDVAVSAADVGKIKSKYSGTVIVMCDTQLSSTGSFRLKIVNNGRTIKQLIVSSATPSAQAEIEIVANEEYVFSTTPITTGEELIIDELSIRGKIIDNAIQLMEV